MVKVFCGRKGSGKTKVLLELANNKLNDSKGNIVYIDDDNAMALRLDSKIRFISTEDFQFENFTDFYGFLCGIISEDYDIDNIFVDGLLNIIPGNIQDTEKLFDNIEKLSQKFKVDFYFNVSCKIEETPKFIGKYME